MISASVIQKFLNKKIDDHAWLKALVAQEVDARLDELNPKPQLTPQLRLHQKVCFLLGVHYPQFFFMTDLGSGKSLITLELLRYWMQAKKVNRWSLVLVPTEQLITNWEEQINLWMPDLPYLLLSGSTKDKWESLKGFRKGLIIGTYVGVSAMLSELRQTNKNLKKRKRVPVVEYVNYFRSKLDAIIYDQATAVGHVESLSYAIARDLSADVKIRYALAGRPFGRDPILLWSQLFLVDRGQTLTGNYGFFRETFFDKKKSFWGGPNTYDYRFRTKMEPQLARLLKHRSVVYTQEELTDLPERTTIIHRVNFPDDMQSYYRKIVQEVLENRGGYREIEAAFVKMRQITSGFLSFKNEDGDTIQMDFKNNPKLDALMSLLGDMPEDRKAIIYYNFTHSGRKICAELTKNKIKHGWLWSGTKNWPQMKAAFDKDPSFKVLVIQSKVGSMGLNLQAASYVLYFESPVSALEREESERRAWRTGQTKHIFQYDIIVRDSVEESILGFHKEGDNLISAIVKNPKILKAA